MKKHKILSVDPDSIAEEMGIEGGDYLLSINDEPVEDIFDYRFMTNEEELTVLIEKADGEEWELDIEKDFDEPLGINFEKGIMDEYRHCANRCIFCFIDQMPKGMRETLYFKDDDSRLSFLQGNYVTLTNMSERDIDRIIKFRLEPINISFQTMNPELRCKMLNNRFAGDALKKVDRLYENRILMNGQIVLCKNINDGKELEYSFRKLYKYLPYLQSVSVVPVGLSKFREGLYPLQPFDKQDALAVLNLIHQWQEKAMAEYQTHFVHAGDEWYFLAEQEVPREENYDGYLQLENGVGMVRLLLEEFFEALDQIPGDLRKRSVSMAAGVLIAPVLKLLVSELKEKFPKVKASVYEIKNEFFGERITVSGLITGQDLENQLKERNLGEELLITEHMLRSGEDVFLDDYHVKDLEKTLQVPIKVVKSSGADLLWKILGGEEEMR